MSENGFRMVRLSESLARRGLTGAKLLISDANEGDHPHHRRRLAALPRAFHEERAVPCAQGQTIMVAAAFRQVADQLRTRWPKRHADVVGIFPNEDSIVRLVGAVLLEPSSSSSTATCRSRTWPNSANP